MGILCSNLYAQTYKEKYAKELYESFAYNKSAKVYSELVDKQIDKKQSVNVQNALKAAESHYHTRNYSEAVNYYNIANEKGSVSGSHLDYYVDALIRTSNYDLLAKLYVSHPEYVDHFGKTLADVKNIQLELKANTGGYILSDFGHNSDEGDYGAIMTAGEVYFCSGRKGIGYTHEEYEWDGMNYSNVFKVDSAGVVSFVKEAHSELHDGPIVFSPDGKTAYITRTEFIKGGKTRIKHVKIYTANVSDGMIGDWTEFKYNSNDYNIGHVCLSQDGLTMYVSSDMPGGFGGADIYELSWENNGWGKPSNLGARINSRGDEMFPFIFEDQYLYYSSNGAFGIGGLDVYSVDLFSDERPGNLGSALNSNMDDFAFNMDENGKVGFLSSDRNGMIDRVYSVEIQKIKGTLIVSTKEVFKNRPVEGAKVWLVDRETNDSTLIVANEKGLFEIPIENRKDYIITGYKKDYELDAPVYLNTDNLQQNEVVEKDLMFNRTHYDLMVKTVVKGTQAICPNVIGEFIDPNTGEIIKFKTDETGTAMVNIENNYDYEVNAHKKGYLDLNQLVHTDAEVLIELDLQMQEIKKDVKFEIKNILYDLAKWDLRPESKTELDKLVEFLTVNDNIKVELSSHTDSRASKSYNQTLSQKRAQSCVDYLIEKGIAKDRIIAKGYGESQLLNQCSDGVECSEDEHQRNRRTEIKILSVDLN